MDGEPSRYLAGPLTPPAHENERHLRETQSGSQGEMPPEFNRHQVNRNVSPPTPAASPSPDNAPKFSSQSLHPDALNWNSPRPFHRSCSELPATPPHQVECQTLIQETTSGFAMLNSYERRTFLEALMPVLSNDDCLYLSTLLQPMLKRDFLKDLPSELGLHILGFLEDPKDLVHASSVSKAWRTLVLDEATWKQLFEKHRFGGGTKPSLLSTKPSKHPGVLPLSQNPDSMPHPTAPPLNTRTVTAPPSRLPGAGAASSRETRTSREPWSIQGTGLRRTSATATSSTDPNNVPVSTHSSVSTSEHPTSGTQESSLSSALHETNASQSLNMSNTRTSGPLSALLPPVTWPDSEQAPMAQPEIVQSAGLSRPLMSSRQDSIASGSNVSSSHMSSVADPYDPQQVGAAAARMEFPFQSSSTESSERDEPNVSSTSTRRSSGFGTTSPPPLPRSYSSQDTSPQSASRPALGRTPRVFSQSTLSFSDISDGIGSPPGRNTSSPLPAISTNPFGQAQIFSSSRSTSTGSGYPAGSSATSADTSPRKQFSYQSEFKRAYLTESNWLRGPGRVLSSQAAGEEGIVTCLCFDSDWIIVGMANNQIHVFDAQTGQYVHTLSGHMLGVWAVALVSKGGFRASRPSTELESVFSSDPENAPQGPLSPEPSFPQDVPMFNTSSLGDTSPFGRSGSSAAAGPDSTSTADGFRSEYPPRPFYGSFRDFSQNTGSSGIGTDPAARNSDPALGSVCGTSLGWGQENALAVSGSCDRDIRVWDVNSGECLHVLQGHRSTVRCLKVLDNRPIAVSGSRDATLRVWDIEKGQQIHVLRGHTDHVRCLEVFGNRAVSGSYDNTCRLWDVDTGQCLFVYTGHFAQIYAVAFDGQRIATGSLDSTVRIWSARTGDCLALLQGHTTLVGQLQLRDSVLVTGGSDGRVIVFSLSTLECLHRLCAHDNSVTCMQFDDRFLVTGGNDGRVKLFDFKTGQFIRELAEPCEAVWRITFRDDKVVIMCRRQGRTTMSLLTFRPDDAEL